MKAEYIVTIALPHGNGVQLGTTEENAKKALEEFLVYARGESERLVAPLVIDGITVSGGVSKSVIMMDAVQQMSYSQIEPESSLSIPRRGVSPLGTS